MLYNFEEIKQFDVCDYQVGLNLTCRQVIKRFPADTNQTDSKDIFKRMFQSVLVLITI